MSRAQRIAVAIPSTGHAWHLPSPHHLPRHDSQGEISVKESFLVGFTQLQHTLPNFSVALALVMLIGASIFAPLFMLRERALRR